MTIRQFAVRATASAGYRLTRLSGRLAAARVSKEADEVASGGGKTLHGDRDIEWTWALAQVHRGPGRVLDFGSGNSNLALGAVFAGNETTAIDLLEEDYPFRNHGIEYIRGDINAVDFEPGSFDQIINCSTIEHVGLAGRYDSPEDPDGDLTAMARLAGLLKPAGTMVLTLPVGRDAVFPPLHRVYGEQRLPLLLEHWTVQTERFWAKPSSNLFEPVSREHAIAERGSTTYYALGLFVLTPA